MSPKGDAPDMHGGEERGCVFSVPCCDSPPSFQVKEGVFYLVAKFVKLFIKGPLGFSIFSGWNNRGYSQRLRLINNTIAIISAVRQQVASLYSAN